MAQVTPELRAAIDAAKERIKVDSYYSKAMNAGLKGNAQGFWGGTALGFFTGGVAGGLISIALHLLAPGLGLIGWPLVLGVAGIGGTAGGAAGARIGAGSGAIAGVAAERERRDKAEKLEQEVLASPARQQEVIEAYRQDPVVEKNDTLGETLATSRTRGQAFRKIVDWKTMLLTVAICALASMALFGGAFLLGGPTAGSVVSSGLGALGMTSIGSALGIGAGAGAGMGVAFGIAYPPLFASLTNKTADLLSGKTVRGKTQFAPIKNVREIEQEAAIVRAQSEPQTQRPGYKIAADGAPSTEISGIVAAERVLPQGRQLTA